MSPRERSNELSTDVLVVGGGLAGGWAATAAARAGASVILVDKGYFGTSGVTATAGPGHWWVPPDPVQRKAAIEERLARAFGLADPDWMERILETTWRTLPILSRYYAFPKDHNGTGRRRRWFEAREGCKDRRRARQQRFGADREG